MMNQSKIVVQNAWSSRTDGNPKIILSKQLQAIKTALKVWKLDVFGRVKGRLSRPRLSLHDAQHMLSMEPTNISLLENERIARFKLLQEEVIEDKLLQRKKSSMKCFRFSTLRLPPTL